MSLLEGKAISVSVFGESHGAGIGAVAEGLPAGEPVDLSRMQALMARRAPGGALATARREADAGGAPAENGFKCSQSSIIQ